MSEDENSENSSLSNANNSDDMETISEPLKELVDRMFMEKNEQTTAYDVVFQELLRRFQQLHKNEDDRQNGIRQGISLCNELIDTVEKATLADINDFQICLQLLVRELTAFESIVRVESEKLFIHEIYCALLDLLSKPQIYSYLNNDQHITILHKESYKCLTNMFLTSAFRTATDVSFTKNDIVTRKYTNILCVMCNRVKCDLQLSTQKKQPIAHDNQTTECILSFLWNLSDRIVIVPWLLGTGFVKTMLECLKITDPSSQVVHQIVSIIHNISRHDDGADELKKFDGLSILKDFQIDRMTNSIDQTNLVLSMAFALLFTPEQIRSDNKRMNKILNQLLQITIEAAEAEDHREKGFHVSEPLAVFTRLFVDDHSLDYVLSHAETNPQLTVSSTITLFAKLLVKFRGGFADKFQLEQFTCTALLNILWSISFQDRYKTKLQQDKELIKTIKSLTVDNDEVVVDQYIPRSMESMSKAANGILYNLNEISDNKETTIAETQIVSNASNGKPMVMISYAHDNNSFCDKILAEFEQNRNLFDIWIDRDHCSSSEDLWEKIARGIGQSNLIICLLSQDYFNSKSCRKEITFAVQRKKAIIPVYIGEPGDCDWLDIHIAGLKYVRFKGNNTELDRGKVQELLKTIQATIKETQTQPQEEQSKQHTIPPQPRKEMETVTSITVDVKKPPEEWTADDIHRWLDSHKVPDTLVKLFDFQSISEIHEYAVILHADPKKEYTKYAQRYAKNHAGDELEEYKFNRFKNALLSLTHNQLQTVKTSMPSGQTSTPKSSACTIS